MIQPQRVQFLNDLPERKGDYVLYWMQASQRASYNHALEYAILQANRLDLPVIVCFGLTDKYSEANLRHYQFMLEGLAQTRVALKKRNIQLVVLRQNPPDAAIELSKNAALVVCDRGYLTHQRNWRADAAKNVRCSAVQVESDVVVPVQQTSIKEEYSAATLRGKIRRQLERYMVPLKHARPKHSSLELKIMSNNIFDISDIPAALGRLDIDRSVKSVTDFRGGTEDAKKLLRDFVKNKLARYPQDRNAPNIDGLSNLSPYIHFGQISPLYIALAVSKADTPAKDVFIEELIIRRELAINFVYFNRNYDKYSSLPQWARSTLKAHQGDKRQYVYSLKQLENAETHDPFWNAAQNQMVITGKMHGYMRMYWGKKIIEWTASPRSAFKEILYLNNKYELDGRDPNGYAGVAWCFAKHDRPWGQRAIFGSVRYMNDKGLLRKFDAQGYADKIDRLSKSIH